MKKQLLKREWRKTVLLRWGLAYAVILLLPLLCVQYGTRKNVQTLRKQVSASNQQILTSVARELDGALKNIKDAYAFTLLESNFSKLKTVPVIDQTVRMNYAYGMLASLKNYVSSTDKDLHILLYYPQKQYVITHASAGDAESYGLMASFDGYTDSPDEWVSAVSESYSSLRFLVSDSLDPYTNEPRLTLAQTVHGQGEPINIFVSLPLRSITEKVLLPDRNLLISDRDGVIYLKEGIAITSLPDGLRSGDTLVGADGENYICNFMPSSGNELTYALITAEHIYWEPLKNTQTIISVSTFAAVLIGLLVSLLFLRQNYRPVDQLMQLTEQSMMHRNEFDLIERTFHKLLDQASRQAPQLRRQYLLDRMKARPFSASDRQLFDQYRISNPGETLVLVAFALDESAKIPSDYKDELEYEHLNFSAISNVFSELAEDFRFDRVEDGHTLLFLLYLDEAARLDWEERGFGFLEKTCSVLSTAMQVPILAALSESTRNGEEISVLYREVVEALEYQRGIGSSGLMRVQDYKALVDPALLHTDYSQLLSNAVEKGDEVMAADAVNRLFAEYRNSTAITFSILRIRVLELLYGVLNTYYKCIPDADSRRRMVLNMERVIAADKESTLQSELYSLLTQACSTVHAATADPTDGLVRRICDYIRLHFADNSLNITTIAEEFQRTPQHISRIFTAQMQKGMLDYLNDVRCTRARILLTESTGTIEDIAIQVGFSNIRTFRRAFSRAVGVPPSAFRSGTDRNAKEKATQKSDP